MVTMLRLCIALIIIIALVLPGTGCIKLGKLPGKQAAEDNPAASGATAGGTAGGQAGQSGSQAPGTAGNQPGQGGQPGAQPSGQDAQVITGGGGVAVANWIGTWQCGNLKMYLNQAGDRVTGWYEYENSDIEGTATGNTLTGTWTVSGVQYGFQIVQSSDGKSFSGRYNQGSSSNQGGSWSCTRISTARPPAKSSGQNSQVITQGGGVAVANWIGTWQCGNNKMYLDQSGNQVTGWFDSENSDIEGSATGNALVGTWTKGGVKYDFQLDQSSDGKSFAGHFRQGSSGAWTGAWSCTRTSSARPPAKPAASNSPSAIQTASWTGTWECNNYKMYLTQTGSKVTGWTELDNGDIEGYATGNTIVGTWTLSGIKYDIQLNQSPDGKSFTGHYRQDSSGNWAGSWPCTFITNAQPLPKSTVRSQPAPAASPISWTGTWQCGQKQIWLLQTGSQVIGWYDEQSGDIKGYVTGNTLVGTWTDASGEKDIQLSMSADGNAFSGHYRTSPSASWISHFSCTKKSAELPAPKVKFDIQPVSITRGMSAQLSWSTILATSVDIKPDIGPCGANGKINVRPGADISYTLSASNLFGGSKVTVPLKVTSPNWSGEWDCGSFGNMILTQSGNQVNGIYTYQGGKISGYVNGNKLAGTWSEDPTHKAPDDAGGFELTLSADGLSFTGYYDYGFSGDVSSWNGKRIR